jgi:hypothetical protein
VVIATRSVSTAKCTNARLDKAGDTGSRSVRYCAIAFSTLCPVNAFFSSAVATSSPFTNRPRSIVFVDPAWYASWRVTFNRFAPYSRTSSGVRPCAGRK